MVFFPGAPLPWGMGGAMPDYFFISSKLSKSKTLIPLLAFNVLPQSLAALSVEGGASLNYNENIDIF
jgi:hypothetical protein